MGLFDIISEKKTEKITSLAEKFGPIEDSIKLVEAKENNYLSESVKSEIDYTIQAQYLGKKLGEPHPFNFELFEAAYKQVPIIFGALNKTVDFALGPGFYIDSDNKAVVKKINTFMEERNFEIFLRTVTRNMLIYGNAFVEIVGDGKNIEQLIVLDPKYIFLRRDVHGKVEKYIQYRGNSKPIEFSTNEIAHFSYNQIGDAIYGTSVLRPLFGSNKVSLLTQFLEMEDAMKILVKRRANAPIHAKIGTDEFPATSADVNTASEELTDLSNKNELVTSHLVSVDVLDFKSTIMDIKPYIEHYENSIIYGLEVPAVLLGRANVPEGLANVQMDAYERRIKSLQSFIEQTIEEKIFKKMFPNDHIEFEWGQPTSELEGAEITQYQNILKLHISDETKEDIENLMRKKLGFKEIKDFKYSTNNNEIKDGEEKNPTKQKNPRDSSFKKD